MSFKSLSLDPRIMAGIEDAGFTTPTPIQEQAIPIVLTGSDVLGLAQTGTGKTAAFTLPILQRLLQGPLRKTRALVVAPTRELAEQIHETVVLLGKNTKIRSTSVYGGVSKGPQLKAMRSGTEVIVACPGRLLDHINEGNVDLSNVEVLVLDEADRMCDMGFLPDIRRIIRKLPKKRQNLFFSATMPREIRTLADEFLNQPQTVQIGMIAPAKTVSHALFPVADGQKNRLLFAILEKTETDRVLIFTRTKRRARFLAQRLEGKGYRSIALQGNMAQNRRQQAINGFKSGQYDVLVATDIAARGIDVAEISHVINFDMPDTVDAYTHRIGRTGRAHANGEAYTFTTTNDEPMIRQIERLLKKRIDRRSLDGFEYSGHASDNPSRAPKTDKPESNGNNGGQQRSGKRSGNSSERNAGGRNSNGRNANGRNAGGRNAGGRNSNGRNSNGRNANGHNSDEQTSNENSSNTRNTDAQGDRKSNTSNKRSDSKPARNHRNDSADQSTSGSKKDSSASDFTPKKFKYKTNRSSEAKKKNKDSKSGKSKSSDSKTDAGSKTDSNAKKSRYDALRRQRRKALKKDAE